MAKVIVGAEIRLENMEKAGQSVGSIKKQLKEAQQDVVNLSDKFGITSKEAAAAARKVADLKDRIGDAKALADTFNPDKKFVALSGALSGAVSGFSALQGAMGLFGAEGEEVQKILLKVNSAMALQQGISGIKGAFDAFKLLGNEISGAVTKAFSTLRGAIIATGIGALAVGVGLLIANFDKLKTALGFVTSEQEKLNELNEKAIDNAIQEQTKVKLLVTEYQNLGTSVNRKKEIQKQLQSDYPAYFGNLKTEKEFADGLSVAYEKLSKALFLKAKIQAASSLIAENEAKALKAELASVNVDDEKLNAIARIKAGIFADPEDIRAKAYLIKAEIEIAGQEEAKGIRKGNQYLIDAILTSQKELDAIGGDPAAKPTATTVKKSAETEEFKLQKRSIEDKKLYGEEVVRINRQTNDLVLQDTMRAGMGKIDAEAALDAISLNNQRILAEQRIALMKQTGEALGALSEVVGKETATGKVLAVAQALINTYQGIAAGVKLGFPLAIPAVAAAAATGFAAVKNILKVKVPGKSGDSGGNIPNLGNTTPSLLQPAFQTTRLDPFSLNQIGNAASRAFVLEHDVATNAERVRRLNRAARIN